MKFKIGRLEVNFGKSYRDLDRMIVREKSGVHGDSKTSPTKQLGEFKSWVSSATSLISKTTSMVPFKAYKKGTDEEINSTTHNYNVFMYPLIRPNSIMTMRFIKAFMQLQLDMCGMAAAYKARNIWGETREIWPLNMNDFMGVYDGNGRPIEYSSEILPIDVNYVFMIGGKYYGFKINDLILLMHTHPKYKFIGASPIQQQAYVTDIQTYIEIYERDFFANSARVDMVLATDNDMEQGAAEIVKQRWLEKYQGKFHDIAVLDKGLKPYPMNFMNKDFEFLNLANWSRDLVLSSYPLNVAKLGIKDGVNRSDSVYVDIEYNRDTIAPRLTQWDEEFTQIVQEYNDKIIIKHDNPVPRDRQIETMEARVYLAGAPVQNINEGRKKQSLPPVTDGNIILVNTKLIPLDLIRPYWKAQIDNIKKLGNSNGGAGPDSEKTDPARHDNDTPHLNPDRTDNRDDLPTDGRSFERTLRELWFQNILKFMKENEKELLSQDNIKGTKLFNGLILSTIKTYLFSMKHPDLETDDWINNFSLKIHNEFKNTIKDKRVDMSWDNFCESQMNLSPRVAKICNSGIKSCINYSRFLILRSHGLNRKWIVNSNICGHRGKVKFFVTNDKFFVGDTGLRFPGENLNLSCDCECSLDVKELTR